MIKLSSLNHNPILATLIPKIRMTRHQQITIHLISSRKLLNGFKRRILSRETLKTYLIPIIVDKERASNLKKAKNQFHWMDRLYFWGEANFPSKKTVQLFEHEIRLPSFSNLLFNDFFKNYFIFHFFVFEGNRKTWVCLIWYY